MEYRLMTNKSSASLAKKKTGLTTSQRAQRHFSLTPETYRPPQEYDYVTKQPYSGGATQNRELAAQNLKLSEPPKNWDQLSRTEKFLVEKGLPWIGKTGAPLFKWMGEQKWLAPLGSAIDVFAAVGERMGSMPAQFRYAAQQGNAGEFLKNIGQAWTAGSLSYDIGINELYEGGEIRPLQLFTTMPETDAALEQVRHKLAAGESIDQIVSERNADLGALAFRSQYGDALGHIFLDPGNIILGAINPIRITKETAQAAIWMGKASPEMISVAEELAADAAKYGDELIALGDIPAAAKQAELVATYTQQAAEMSGKAMSFWEKTAAAMTGGVPPDVAGLGAWVAKSPKGFARLIPTNWFRLTPSSRAMQIVTMMHDYGSNLVKGARSAEEVMEILAKATGAASSSDLLKLTMGGRAAGTWLKLGMTGAQSAYEAQQVAKPLARMTDFIAQVLGVEQRQVVGRLITGDAEEVLRAVTGSLQGIDPKLMTASQRFVAQSLAEGTLTSDMLQLAGKSFGAGVSAPAFDLLSFKTKVMNSILDATAQSSVLISGVQHAGFWQKAADMTKAAETLMFLRLNPGYPLRNFLNNEITMMARGVWGLMPQGMRGTSGMLDFWDKKVGFRPARLAQGFGMAGDAGAAGTKLADDALSAATNVVAKAGRGEGVMVKIADKIRDIRLPVDFGGISQRMEQSASVHAMTSAYLKAHSRFSASITGVGKFFADAGVDLPEDIAKIIDDGIRSGYTADDIAKVLFEEAPAVTRHGLLESTAKKLGISSQDLIEGDFGSEIVTHADDMAQAALKGDEAAVRGLSQEAMEQAQRHIGDQLDSFNADVAMQQAEAHATAGQWEGVLASESRVAEYEFGRWQGHLQDVGAEAKRIADLPPGSRGAAWGVAKARWDTEWDKFFTYMRKSRDGWVRGMKNAGIDVGDVSKATGERIDAIKSFNTSKERILRSFFDGDYATATERSRAWEVASGEIDQVYQSLGVKEQGLLKRIDDAVGSAIPDEKLRAFHVVERERIRALRAGYQDFQRELMFKANTATTEAEKRAILEAATPERMNWQFQVADAEKGYRALLYGDAKKVADATADLGERFVKRLFGMFEGKVDEAGQSLIKGQIVDDLTAIQGKFPGRTPEELSKARAAISWTADRGDLYVVRRSLEEPEYLQGEILHELAHPFRDDYLADIQRVFGDEELFANKLAVYVLNPEEGARMSPAFRELFERMLTENPEMATTMRNIGAAYKEQLGEGMRETILRAAGRNPVPAHPDTRTLIPDMEPRAFAADEVYNARVRPAMLAMEDEAVGQMRNRPVRFADMTPEQQKVLRAYAERASGEMGDVNMASIQMAEFGRDSALLNYTRRTHFDTATGMVFPYSFWMTHSMYNWALYSLDNPWVLSSYYKIQQFMSERIGQDKPGFPSRLSGMAEVPIPLPFWEPWMGKAFYNPLSVGLPFEGWSYPIESYAQQMTTEDSKAASRLQQLAEGGEISAQVAQDAIQTRSGDVWNRAIADVREGSADERNDMFDFMNMFAAPHAPFIWAYNVARGTPERIGPFLPITRTVRDATAMLGWGPPGGVNIEGWLRKQLGLPSYDRWDDYRVDRMLANMAADGTVSTNDALRAMLERSGETFNLAVTRAGKERAYKGILGLAGIQVGMLPAGEEKQRILYAQFIKLMDEGDQDKIERFFDQNPEVSARLALFKTPEERMRQFLVDEVWQKYNDLPDLHKQEARDQLGDLFGNAFLNKNTRSYTSIGLDTLGAWLKVLGGDTVGGLGKEAVPLNLAPPYIAQRAQQFFNIRRNRYPNWYKLQETYYRLEEGASRKQYLRENPEYAEYRDWRYKWLYDNPDTAPYLTDNPDNLPKYESGAGYQGARIQEVLASLPPASQRLVVDYIENGDPIPAVLRKQLEDMGIDISSLR